MSFPKFNKKATLRGGKVRVAGPLRLAKGEQKAGLEVRFLIIQGNVTARGTGKPTTSGWGGTAAKGRLQVGPAQAVGLAIAVKRGPAHGFATHEWSEPIQLTK